MDYLLGQIILFAGSGKPAGLSLLPCDGTFYPASAYPALISFSSRSIVFDSSGTHFATPDLRALMSQIDPYGRMAYYLVAADFNPAPIPSA